MNYQMATLIIAVVSVVVSLYQHTRITQLPDRLRAEITADAKLAAAMLIADALVAAAKIKADAAEAKRDIT